MNFNFNPMAFVKNLIYMGAGMFSIFAVILVIIAIVCILNAVTGKKDKKQDSAEN